MNATPLRVGTRRAARGTRGVAAFTLVELLTVIAIIAILAAIILPVFGSVRENARRSACMSNMQQLSQAVKLYELDNRRYPDYLLGPAIAAAPGGGCARTTIDGQQYLVMAAPGGAACTIQEAAGTNLYGGQYAQTATATTTNRFQGGLYPEYIRSLETFHCPNATEDLNAAERQNDPRFVTSTRPTVGPGAGGATSGPVGREDAGVVSNIPYYRYDSYDANPAIDFNNSRNINPNAFITRYSRLWTRVFTNNSGDPIPNPNSTDEAERVRYEDYRNQLYWRAPGGDTLITACTYHAPKGKVTMLWLGGGAKSVDVRKLRSQDGRTVTVPAGRSDIQSTSWSRDLDLFRLGAGE